MTSILETSMSTLTSEVIDDTGSTSGLGATTVDIGATSSDSNVVQPTATMADNPSTQLQDSFTISATESSQYPMQHATTQLPSNQLPMATTDTMSRLPLSQSTRDVAKLDNIVDTTTSSVLDSSDVTGATDVINSISESDITASVTTDSGIDSPTDSVTDHVITSLSHTTDSVFSDPNEGTTRFTQSAGNTAVPTVVPTSTSFAQSLSASSSDISINTDTVSSLDYATTVSELYSTYTPVETTFTSVAQTLDTGSFQTSSAAAPIPDVTGKPVQPSSKGQSTILGGTVLIDFNSS